MLTAVVILTAFFWSGPPQFKVTHEGRPGRRTRARRSRAGLRAGDLIVRVNGKARARTRAGQRTRSRSPGKITLVVRRAGALRDARRRRRRRRAATGARYLGFVVRDRARRQPALRPRRQRARGRLRSLVHDVRDVHARSATSSRAASATRSRARSASCSSRRRRINEGVYPRLLALISLSLAIFNLLPFLPLDGGHILFALIEFFRRRPLAPRGLRARLADRHRRDADAVRDRPLERRRAHHQRADDRAVGRPGREYRCNPMASERQIVVGGVPIGGGVPGHRPVDDDDQDARRRGDDGADRPRSSRPASTSCASPCPACPMPTRCPSSSSARRCR